MLDQVTALLAVIRQSGDFAEGRYALDLEEEMTLRRDAIISGLATAEK